MKTNCNPVKLRSVIEWIQSSRTAHSIKDLERVLPSVASINGMQVKDYIQALTDENKIRVEKIGSGNWYWSFPSEEKKTREKALTEATLANQKAEAVVQELRGKVAAATKQREEDNNTGDGESREELVQQHGQLEDKVEGLRNELAKYSDSDPTELERKKEELARSKEAAQKWTDECLSMEAWLLRQGINRDQLDDMKRDWYGAEYDEENEGLADCN
ncbi:hypothetical protein H2203_004065 [Taxawa tesnikishii (nom. ined.)]|nr:hypothetical protein H2203_004065 [Dothideales sp. JES 119]